MSGRWDTKSLGSLCDFVRGPFGGSLKKSCFKTVGYAVYEQQHAIYDQFENIRYFIDESKYLEMKRFELSPGDLIMSCSGTMGRVAIVPDGVPQGIINQALLKLSPKKGIVVEFLKYWMNSPNFQNELTKLSQGVAIKNVASVKVLKEIQIFLPSPNEQKRIVAIVDQAFEAIDSAIENTKQNLANARELFESYLNAILTQNDNGWRETALGAEIDLMTGFPFKSIRYTDSAQSIRLLRGDNIIQCALRWDDVKKWPESEIDEFLTYQLKEGDVVLAMDRPWVKAGLKHAMISSDDLPCLLVQRTACLRASKDINNRFLMYLIGSHAFTRHILSNQTGIGVPHISGKQIQGFAFLKPPVSKQKIISDNLDELRLNIQRLESIYRQKLAALTELKQSILQKAFTGELTADQEAP